jgi:uncharacterized OB-fold protein
MEEETLSEALSRAQIMPHDWLHSMLDSDTYRNASEEEKQRMLQEASERLLQESLEKYQPRPLSPRREYIRDCPYCGRKQVPVFDRYRCASCCREQRRAAQKRRRLLRSGLVEIITTDYFSVVRPVKFKCQQCGKDFLPQRTTAKFCSARCRLRAFRTKSRGSIEEERNEATIGRSGPNP